MRDAAMQAPARRVALVGLIGLAAAMGIGRFAFTPLLPLMQAEGALSLAAGSWLASANYVGYLLGALLTFALNPRPTRAAKLGLATVALSTLAMAATASVPIWLLLRAIAGIASAFVLVGVSAWALDALAAQHRANWSGWVFAGVGSGILFAGLAALAVALAGFGAPSGWLALGAAAALAALLAMQSIAEAPTLVGVPRGSAACGFDRTAWRLILCYGVFGYGYIIPATFLPAAARALIDDPMTFGWTWPLFGLAAALSTVVASSTLGQMTPRRRWALGQLILAAGVALPALHASLPTMIVSALAVGGTFMVVTMAGMQEAQRVGASSASRLMAAMTAAFATGQLIGPLTIAAAQSAAEAIRGPSLFAAALLCLAALALFPERATAAQPRSER